MQGYLNSVSQIKIRMQKNKVYWYTFISVLLSIFVIGYVGVYTALDYMEGQYIRLQIDINKRQAETMAKLLEYQLNQGDNKETVRKRFQEAIVGSESDKGFLCMFDRTTSELICHPDEKMVGMNISETFSYNNFETGKTNKTHDVLAEGNAVGGLFNTDSGTDISYMIPVKGTKWMISAHENIVQIKEQVNKQRWLFNVGFIILGLIIAVLSTFFARRISYRYEKQIEDKNKLLAKKMKLLENKMKKLKQEFTMQVVFSLHYCL